MFEPLPLGREPETGAAHAPPPPSLTGTDRLEAHLLHCAIASLREARECATGEADAPTIYARIDGLMAERRARLDELLQGNAETRDHLPQAPRAAL